MHSDDVDEAWLTVDVLVHPKGVVWGLRLELCTDQSSTPNWETISKSSSVQNLVGSIGSNNIHD